MKFLSKMSKRTKEDKGASNTISFIVIMFFVMIMLVSFIDIGIYFNVKNEMRSAAENGARNVALYGGTEGSLRVLRGANDSIDVVRNSITSNHGSVVEMGNVTCGPEKAVQAGDPVWCDVSYKYNGLAGKFSIFNINESNIKVRGSAVSEVGFGHNN